MRELILIRTHFYSDAVGELYHFLSETSGRDVILVCDESGGLVNVGPGKVKLGISSEFAKGLDLYSPRQFGWLCGDYFIYAAINALPNYDRYWLVESDVRFGLERSSEMFDHFTTDDSDLLAFQLYKSKGNWYWHSPMSYFTDDVYACLFPLIRVSKRAASAAYKERVAMSATFEGVVPKEEKRRWPNDESFLATTLMTQGYKCKDFNSGTRKFADRSTFGVGVPKAHGRIANQVADGMIYHPVHSKEKFTRKANNWLTTFINSRAPKEKMLKTFDEVFQDDFRREASPEELVEFRRRLSEFLESAPA